MPSALVSSGRSVDARTITPTRVFVNTIGGGPWFDSYIGNAPDNLEIEEDRFGFEPEITAKVLRRGEKIVELPVSFEARTFAEGKKIGWRDGVRALYCILKYRFQ